ncbi:PIG-U-domain-containing protein [Lichtheimia hyalospora FSU 10163]|nr:PIG-U-domain-containing protein [Lichtheimia hyalospora FSU 10163]
MVSLKDRVLGTNIGIYACAILLRITISSFPSLVSALSQRVELVTPVTSFKKLTEGVFLYQSNVPPYDGGQFHQPPLLLCIFSFLMAIPSSYIIPLLYSLIDVAIAHSLQKLAIIKQQYESKQPKLDVEQNMRRIRPQTIAILYLFNPFTILSCVSKSSILFTNLSVIMATLWASLGNAPLSMIWVALASYLSFYPAMLVPPLLIMSKQMSRKSNVSRMAWSYTTLLGIAMLVTSIAGLLYGSRFIVGSWDFMEATYGVILFLPDLTPNTGMFWYFFIEIFDHFRSFFLVVFQLHAFIFAAPLCIRLRNHPLLVVTILAGILAVFKSYPSIGDATLFLSLVPLHDELFKYCRYGFLVVNIFLYSSVLAPIFWHLWLYAGSGNANFFYAITLVYNLGLVLLLIDLVYSATRRDFDIANPDSIGKNIVHK